jgi:large subunit ribosomal protein L25
MGDKVALTVEGRKIIGKKVKSLRKEGVLPGVVYGNGVDATPVMVAANVAEKAWHEAGKHHIVELTMDGKIHLAMIKSADFEPVKRRLRHLSLQVVKQNEKVETEVPIHVVGEGETVAEKAGLVVLKTIESVQVSAFPKDLPDFVEVPGDKLAEPGDHLTVGDITPPKGVAILSDPEQIVVTVYEPSALAAANDAAGGDATEETEVAAENGAAAEGEELGAKADDKK